jgi:hypothetical protein
MLELSPITRAYACPYWLSTRRTAHSRKWPLTLQFVPSRSVPHYASNMLATRALYTRWQRDLLAAVPTARIVELPGANLFMFLSNEADVLREVRAFVAR